MHFKNAISKEKMPDKICSMLSVKSSTIIRFLSMLLAFSTVFVLFTASGIFPVKALGEEDIRIIIFDPGEYGCFERSSVEVLLGEATPSPPSDYSNSSNPDYIFDGWEPEISDTVNDDAEYIAKWILRDYTVSFYSDGSSFTTRTVKAGSSLGADMPSDPEKLGYEFTGWSSNGDAGFCESTPVTGDIDVYAVFRPMLIKFYIAFNKNGKGAETLLPIVEYYDVGDVLVPKPADAVYPDFLFGGWYTEAACINEWNFSSGRVEIPYLQEFVVLTLYAKWTPIYTVVFSDGIENSETILKTEKVVKGKDATAPEIQKRVGYTFKEWDTVFTNVQKNLEVKAVWLKNKYTVTFLDMDKKTVLEKQTVFFGDNAKPPEPPKHVGYVFYDWDVDFKKIKSDLTVTAQYDKEGVEMFTVTFVDWDGQVLNKQRIEKGKGASAPVSPKREGFEFTGWDKKFDKILSDMTITAKYKEVKQEKQKEKASGNNEEVFHIGRFSKEDILLQARKEGILILTLGRLSVPLTSPKSMSSFTWGFANLIMTVLGLVFLLISLFKRFERKKASKTNDDFSLGFQYMARSKRYIPAGSVISIVMGVIGAVFFFATSNISGLLTVFDRWTVFSVFILIMGIIGFSLGNRQFNLKQKELSIKAALVSSNR